MIDVNKVCLWIEAAIQTVYPTEQVYHTDVPADSLARYIVTFPLMDYAVWESFSRTDAPVEVEIQVRYVAIAQDQATWMKKVMTDIIYDPAVNPTIAGIEIVGKIYPVGGPIMRVSERLYYTDVTCKFIVAERT